MLLMLTVHNSFLYFQDGNKLTRGLKLMGLCSWGYVKDREDFVNQNPSEFNYCRSELEYTVHL